jgi:hypothetical protein
MFKSTYSKEEVQDLISKSMQSVKDELVQYIHSLEKKNILLEETIDLMKLEQKNALNNKFYSIQSDIDQLTDTVKTISNKVDLINEKLENTTSKLNNKIDICSINIIRIEKDLIENIDYNLANVQRNIGYKINGLEELVNSKK